MSRASTEPMAWTEIREIDVAERRPCLSPGCGGERVRVYGAGGSARPAAWACSTCGGIDG